MISGRKRFTSGAHAAMLRHLQRVFPGQSIAVRRLRAQLIEFACDPLSDRLLIKGPVGIGKSVLAINAAFLKWIAPMQSKHAEEIVDSLRFRGPGEIEPVLMPWYVEMSLTGLVEDLAAAQLFGVVKGGFTGAIEHPGVFEQAMCGRTPNNPPEGAQLTGGVVFLDEIGDLPPALQPKLLPVLSGGKFYRVGGEGKSEFELSFTGIAIAATWRSLDPPGFRADLLSRISGFVIEIPSLSERLEDFEPMLDEAQKSAMCAAKARLERLQKADQRRVDRVALEEFGRSIEPLDAEARKKLKNVEWGRFGNLRGLRRAVEQIIAGGRDVLEVIEQLHPILFDASERDNRYQGDVLLTRLLAKEPDARGLAAHVKDLEYEQRRALRDRLSSDFEAQASLSRRLGMSEKQLRDQLYHLSRRRTSD